MSLTYQITDKLGQGRPSVHFYGFTPKVLILTLGFICIIV